jgi:hypothetical protein
MAQGMTVIQQACIMPRMEDLTAWVDHHLAHQPGERNQQEVRAEGWDRVGWGWCTGRVQGEYQ